MKRIMMVSLVGLLLSLGAGTARAAGDAHKGHAPSKGSAHGMDHGSMSHGKMGMGESGMSHDKDMHAMHSKMQALHEHWEMMQGMKDSPQLREAMKKHMSMMDEMMEVMMKEHMQGMSGSGDKP